MQIDPWILAFSALTVIATVWMGFWSAKRSRTAGDFFVAGRSVSVGWNASAISGEYLSAASFMGVAGMVMSSGYDALWYPVCYACGYLFLLLFIAGPLRRFGAYTIPDFAEGRFVSPLFRKIAVVFVLFIGFFYTMPQMKGAGTTLAYIFPGLPYWAGVVLVGAVITLNVAMGGMKGITLVQAFQYWLKMFAISVPIFVLMAVYGHYGKQLEDNLPDHSKPLPEALKKLEYEVDFSGPPGFWVKYEYKIRSWLKLSAKRPYFFSGKFGSHQYMGSEIPLYQLLSTFGALAEHEVLRQKSLPKYKLIPFPSESRSSSRFAADVLEALTNNGITLVSNAGFVLRAVPTEVAKTAYASEMRKPLPAKAPPDDTWLNPFGPLTTKAAKTAAAARTNIEELVTDIPLKPGTPTDANLFVRLERAPISQALDMYGGLVGRTPPSGRTETLDQLDKKFNFLLTRLHLLEPPGYLPGEVNYRNTNPITAGQLKSVLETAFTTNRITVIAIGDRHLQAVPTQTLERLRQETRNFRIQSLARTERAYALLYTYSLIIALVCGTAGLPHILVRFYTNPNGVAAKRTTMWVMILIGVFYLFPPVFGVLGRNLMPDLYAATGAKGTDKVVLELPRILNKRVGKGESEKVGETANVSPAHSPTFSPAIMNAPGRAKEFPWGSLLSGITCAGAFAAFMSTFSGLLVSLTGALAHDVYGRMLNPESTPDQRMRMFKVCAVLCGSGAILLGFFVEKFEINKMVGWAFAIAATSYFPLLFLSSWWRGITMKGAATGMLVGGTFSLVAIASTMFADQASWAKGLADFYAGHPLLRILAEQPAIWALPLAIILMVVVSKLTRAEVPADIRMKMLVLHAPEKLGLKQEYIQEHQAR